MALNKMDVPWTESRSPVIRDLRIVLVGKTGAGKSSTGNTILGRKVFQTAEISMTSVTTHSLKRTTEFDDRTVTVVDTPGVFDTSMTDEELRREMDKCICHSVPGPHVFLLVISLRVRFTREERNAVRWIKDNFGETASKHTLVLFTGGDKLRGQPLDMGPQLQELIACIPRYLLFDNTLTYDRTQVSDLFKMIDEVVERNGSHYTSDIYQRAQRKIDTDEMWRSVGDKLDTVGDGLAVATMVAPIAGLARVGSAVMATGAMASKLLGRWMKPKEEG